MAFHSLGDEINPSGESSDEKRAKDASTREDESPEAAERRRQARQDILERGRRLEERRRAKLASQSRTPSFNDFVDKDGALKPEMDAQNPISYTTAAELQQGESQLWNRATEARGVAFGAALANPFADEFAMDDMSDSSPLGRVTSPPLPPKPAAYQPQQLAPLIPISDYPSHFNESHGAATPKQEAQPELIETTGTVSQQASEAETPSLLDLTPTTSAPGSPLLSSPVSAAAVSDLVDLHAPVSSLPQLPQAQSQNSSYHSINAWTLQQSQMLNPAASPSTLTSNEHEQMRLERAMSDMISLSEHENDDELEGRSTTMSGSIVDCESRFIASGISANTSENGRGVSSVQDDEEYDEDEDDGVKTPATGTWTEVGSQVSGDF